MVTSNVKRKVLLVEDESVVRTSIRDWLSDDGFKVECVECGEEALERIKKEGFGVIILDLRLPGIDGLQVFEQAREISPETKGVLITAYPSEETKKKAKTLGFLDYMAKPFQIADLEKSISAALGEAERKITAKEHHWLELGAVSYRLCDWNYECSQCPFAKDIRDKGGTIAIIGDDEIAKLKQLPSSQKLCRNASVHFVEKKLPHLH